MLVVLVVLGVLAALAIAWATSAAEERHKRELARAIEISDVDTMSGLEFEHYVSCLLKHQGYSAEVTKSSGDFGADILATKNSVRFAIQTKRYSKKVSNKAINEAFAAMAHYKCGKCVVVTNSYFTAPAQKLAKSTGCELVDRYELANWILDFQGKSEPAKNSRGAKWVSERQGESIVERMAGKALLSELENDVDSNDWDIDHEIVDGQDFALNRLQESAVSELPVFMGSSVGESEVVNDATGEAMVIDASSQQSNAFWKPQWNNIE